MTKLIEILKAVLLLVAIACGVLWFSIGLSFYRSEFPNQLAAAAGKIQLELLGDGKNRSSGLLPKLDLLLIELNQTSNIIRHSSSAESKQIISIGSRLETSIETINRTVASIGKTADTADKMLSSVVKFTLPEVDKTIGQVGDLTSELKQPSIELLTNGVKVLQGAVETESILNQHLPAIADSVENVAGSGDRLARTFAELADSLKKELTSPKPWYQKLQSALLIFLKVATLVK